MAKYKNFVGLGIAGNFALHLEQAGEVSEFKDIITQDEAAPKGIFPFYIPTTKDSQNAILQTANPQLHTYPLGSEYIKLPSDGSNIQVEPEVALVCHIEYMADKIESIKPTHFGAFNDCSIRRDGASKISQKKNWGEYSKGFSNQLIEIDDFSQGGAIDSYSIASYLLRDGSLHEYGEDVELVGYSYFHEKLTDWIVDQLNSQDDFGPLENISSYLQAANKPHEAIISIGATRYSEFGEKNFLKEGDEIFVVLYNRDSHESSDVIKAIKSRTPFDGMSMLHQRVIR